MKMLKGNIEMKMKLFKRNAVIITAVAFLGVAVYLNWSYGRNEDEAAAGLSGNSEEVLINEYVEPDEEISLFYEPAGATQAVAAIYNDVSDYFATARLTRQQARDSAVNILQAAAELENATQEAIDGAMAEMSVMAGFSLNEVEIETLIKAKGFDECVVFLDDDSVTVAVSAPEGGLSSSSVSKITDIILAETELTAEQIKIIEVK